MTEEKWKLEEDDDGEYICFEGKGDVDFGFRVYIPDPERQPDEHDRAIQIIVEALKNAGIVVD